MFDIRHYTKKTCFRKCCFYSISFFFLRKCLGRCRHSFRFSWYTKEGKQIDVDKWYIFATQTMSKALKLAKLVLRHSFLRGSCWTMESFKIPLLGRKHSHSHHKRSYVWTKTLINVKYLKTRLIYYIVPHKWCQNIAMDIQSTSCSYKNETKVY